MDAIEAILSRRSIRKYSAEMIPQQIIDLLLKAAMAGPTAHNSQCWRFIVIDDHQIMDKIPEFHPYASMLLEAQLAIAICGDTSVQPDRWMLDCAAAAENILLAAHASGLGAVWVGIYPVAQRIRDVKQLLNLPDHIFPMGLISLGYPEETRAPSNRFDPSKIHKNQW
jgi:nitroreductase